MKYFQGRQRKAREVARGPGGAHWPWYWILIVCMFMVGCGSGFTAARGVVETAASARDYVASEVDTQGNEKVDKALASAEHAIDSARHAIDAAEYGKDGAVWPTIERVLLTMHAIADAIQAAGVDLPEPLRYAVALCKQLLSDNGQASAADSGQRSLSPLPGERLSSFRDRFRPRGVRDPQLAEDGKGDRGADSRLCRRKKASVDRLPGEAHARAGAFASPVSDGSAVASKCPQLRAFHRA